MNWLSEFPQTIPRNSAGRGLLALLLLAATPTFADPPSPECIKWRKLAKTYKTCRDACFETYHQFMLSAAHSESEYNEAKSRRKQCTATCAKESAPYSVTGANSPCP